MQRAVARLLTVCGAAVTIAPNGLEATHKTLTESFDLVLMDLRMPVMDGFDATRALRAAGCQVTIIAVSADVAPVVEMNALAAGFDAVLSKPFGVSDLVRAMQTVRERQPMSQRTIDSRAAEQDESCP
jgi:hypothetical protein